MKSRYDLIVKATNDLLDIIDIPKANNTTHWYSIESGKEHYRLLAYACKDLDLVFDVGTFVGSSSLAMSTAKNVISYDVVKANIDYFPKPKNIKYKIGSVVQDKQLLDAQLILLDTYHDGEFERVFIEYLIASGWHGILIMDDIHLNKQMKDVWDFAVQKSTEHRDITHIGHHSGTGILLF